MPHVSRHRRIDILDGDAPAVRRVIERDIVFQGIRACDVVVVAVLPAPDDATRLVFLAGERLEARLDKSVFQLGAGEDAPGEGAAARLLEHIRLARRRRVGLDRQAGLALAGTPFPPALGNYPGGAL